MPGLSRRRFIGVSLGCCAAAIGVLHQRNSPWRRFSRSSYALGTTVSMTVLSLDAAQAEKAMAAAYSEIEAVEEALSLYRSTSDLGRLNRDFSLVNPNPRLVEVLRYAAQVSEITDGAFDVTVQPLWKVYDFAKRNEKLPDDIEIDIACERVNWRRVEVSDGFIQLRGRGTQITLNGIAQGYAADRAKAVLQKHGIQHALLNTGELLAVGTRDSSPWTIGIQHPRLPEAYSAIAALDSRALATSGDYATTFTSDRRHNHLVDPRTGRSPAELASVSVAAATAMEADALSTACFVLGLEKSLSLLRTRPECDALFVTKDNRQVTTAGFPKQVEEVHHG